MALNVSVLLFVAVSLTVSLVNGYPIHASCRITWKFPSVTCADVADKTSSQMKTWESADNCKSGGEKCLYKITSQSDTELKGTHTTPVKKYVDDLTFTLTTAGSGCNVQAFSNSETWYAYLDYGTNYCNLRNLIDGSGLNKTTGFEETTSDSVCTQYSSHDCEKY